MRGVEEEPREKIPSMAYRPTILTAQQQPPHCFCCHNTHTQLAANFTRLPKLTKLLTRKAPKRLSPHLGIRVKLSKSEGNGNSTGT